MIYFILARFLTFLLDLIATIRRSDHEKDLEILLLRHNYAFFSANSRTRPVFPGGRNLHLSSSLGN